MQSFLFVFFFFCSGFESKSLACIFFCLDIFLFFFFFCLYIVSLCLFCCSGQKLFCNSQSIWPILLLVAFHTKALKFFPHLFWFVPFRMNLLPFQVRFRTILSRRGVRSYVFFSKALNFLFFRIKIFHLICHFFPIPFRLVIFTWSPMPAFILTVCF